MRLQARSLAVIRGERLVLAGIDLDLAGGGALVLRGPNGAGKSTLIRVLAGLRRADAGTLTVDDVPVDHDLVAHARRVAFLGPLDAIKPALTVAANLRLTAAAPGRARVRASLERVGLAALANLPSRYLSTGQKRRVAIARLLLAPASDLLLLDEPVNGLDDEAVALLGAILAERRHAGVAVVVAAHGPLPIEGGVTLTLPGASSHRSAPRFDPDQEPELPGPPSR